MAHHGLDFLQRSLIPKVKGSKSGPKPMNAERGDTDGHCTSLQSLIQPASYMWFPAFARKD